jgi:sec-independent protein translocase protein TatA
MPFGNLSGPTLLVILFIVLLLFGAPKLPALARSIGQSMKILKKEVTTPEEGDKDQAAAAATEASAPAAPAAAPAAPAASSAPSTDEELARAKAEAEAARAEAAALRAAAEKRAAESADKPAE